MRPRSLVLILGAFTIITAACAKSSPIHQMGTGGASQSSSSAGGAGGSGMGGMGGAGGAQVVLPCAESPCKLTSPQCGCTTAQECTTDPKSLDPTFRVCVPKGIQGPGQKCSPAGAGCAPGLVCVQKGGMPAISTCTAYCAADGDCVAPGGLCVLTLGDGKGGTIPNAALCTENCNPITSAECVTGLACRLDTETTGQLRSYTRCLGAGAGTQKSTCATNADCAAGFTCLNAACARYCTVGGNDCTGGLNCKALQVNGKDVVLGGTTYGTCL